MPDHKIIDRIRARSGYPAHAPDDVVTLLQIIDRIRDAAQGFEQSADDNQTIADSPHMDGDLRTVHAQMAANLRLGARYINAALDSACAVTQLHDTTREDTTVTRQEGAL